MSTWALGPHVKSQQGYFLIIRCTVEPRFASIIRSEKTCFPPKHSLKRTSETIGSLWSCDTCIARHHSFIQLTFIRNVLWNTPRTSSSQPNRAEAYSLEKDWDGSVGYKWKVWTRRWKLWDTSSTSRRLVSWATGFMSLIFRKQLG